MDPDFDLDHHCDHRNRDHYSFGVPFPLGAVPRGAANAGANEGYRVVIHVVESVNNRGEMLGGLEVEEEGVGQAAAEEEEVAAVAVSH
jgi:hypothetical protein